MHHRASHERLRDSVISIKDYALSIAQYQSTKSRHPKSQLIECAKKILGEELQRHLQVLDSMLEIQRLEAEALAGTQTLERGEKVPELAISFPFPDVFKQIKESTIMHIERKWT